MTLPPPAPLLHPRSPQGAFWEQAGGGMVPCSQDRGSPWKSFLIVLFMKLWEGFPVGFLMNWFVVDADNYSANGGSRLISFPTSFQPPSIKHKLCTLGFSSSFSSSEFNSSLTHRIAAIHPSGACSGWLSGRKRKLEPQIGFFSVLLDPSSTSVIWEQTGLQLLRSTDFTGGLFLPKSQTLCFILGMYREKLGGVVCVPPLPFLRTTPLSQELAFRLHCYGKSREKSFKQRFWSGV